MKNEPISPEVSRRICLHMNKEHISSIFNYAVKYGAIENPKEVEMLEINKMSMTLNIFLMWIYIYLTNY